jgi:hypothetical protein
VLGEEVLLDGGEQSLARALDESPTRTPKHRHTWSLANPVRWLIVQLRHADARRRIER